MCIANKEIITNKKILYNIQKPQIIIKYKCGECFQCLEDKSKESTYRSYWQAKETFDKGGYVIFDTLSYNDKSLPHINEVLNLNDEDNFSCFRNSDYTNFMKLLRIKLKRQYGNGHKLSMLTTGEYGTDDNYIDEHGRLRKATFRPHYHLIVNYTCDNINNRIKPYKLSLLISECWTHGRTDGVKYKGLQYFNKKRLFTEQNPYNLNLTRYVCKYVEKESKYAQLIKYRCNKILKSKGLIGNLNYYDKLEANKIKNAIRQHKRTSNNYGSYALKYLDKDKLINNSIVTYPDTKYVFKTLPLPLYYKRKLFMKLFYYNVGKNIHAKWEYTKEGEQYKLGQIKQEYNSLKLKYTNLFINSNNTTIKSLLNNRSIDEFINYLMFYKNRPYTNKLWKTEDILNNINLETNDYYYNYSTAKDFTDYGDRYISRNPIEQNNKLIKINSLKLINDKYSTKFENFDKLYALLTNEDIKIGRKRHQDYLLLKEKKDRLKQLII